MCVDDFVLHSSVLMPFSNESPVVERKDTHPHTQKKMPEGQEEIGPITREKKTQSDKKSMAHHSFSLLADLRSFYTRKEQQSYVALSFVFDPDRSTHTGGRSTLLQEKNKEEPPQCKKKNLEKVCLRCELCLGAAMETDVFLFEFFPLTAVLFLSCAFLDSTPSESQNCECTNAPSRCVFPFSVFLLLILPSDASLSDFHQKW